MLSTEFQDFYHNWINKAKEYGTNEVRECFDKFFTLFVIYNRLYAEVTFTLVRAGRIPRLKNDIIHPRRPRRNFPDRMAATQYLQQYLGSHNIINKLDNNIDTTDALNTIYSLLGNRLFYVKLDALTGKRQKSQDEILLGNLRSINSSIRAGAVLDLVYSIRCNMFHGHKGFQRVQIELLQPVIIILEKLIELIYQKLSNEAN